MNKLYKLPVAGAYSLLFYQITILLFTVYFLHQSVKGLKVIPSDISFIFQPRKRYENFGSTNRMNKYFYVN